MENYSISIEDRQKLAGIVVLFEMAVKNQKFSAVAESTDINSLLETLLRQLTLAGYVTILGTDYVITKNGREFIRNQFLERYKQNLEMYDILAMVDYTSGPEPQFALCQKYNYDENSWKEYFGEAEFNKMRLAAVGTFGHLPAWEEFRPVIWEAFKAETRWQDLRVVAAKFRNSDPVDMVFMSFLNEGQFNTDKTGWQFNLLLGTVWNEIENIINHAITFRDLDTVNDKNQPVAGEEILKVILGYATSNALELIRVREEIRQQQEAESSTQQAAANQDDGYGGVLVQTVTETTVEEIVVEDTVYYSDPRLYYDPWFDPFYNPWPVALVLIW